MENKNKITILLVLIAVGILGYFLLKHNREEIENEAPEKPENKIKKSGMTNRLGAKNGAPLNRSDRSIPKVDIQTSKKNIGENVNGVSGRVSSSPVKEVIQMNTRGRG